MATKKNRKKQNNNRIPKDATKQKSSVYNQKKEIVITALRWLLGAVVVAFLGVYTQPFIEARFPRVYVEERITDRNLPCCHLLSANTNDHILASFNEPVSLTFSIENDNSSAIRVEETILNIVDFVPVSDEDYLVLRPWFSQGAAGIIPLTADTVIDPNKRSTYKLGMLDKETGSMDHTHFIEAESRKSILFNSDIEFTDSGVYTLELSVSFVIHGKKHIHESNTNSILYITKDILDHKNVVTDLHKDDLIVNEGNGKYKVYANGNAVIMNLDNEKDAYSLFYNFYDFLINTVTIADGVERLNQKYLSGIGPHYDKQDLEAGYPYVKTLYLPKSLKEIEDNTFYDDFYVDRIIYEGSETEWNKIKIGSKNKDLREFLVFQP